MYNIWLHPNNLEEEQNHNDPKARKDYSEAKSYRPISLTPFLFKTLERLCFWHSYETALTAMPIHERQHAYRPGYSTESAISQVIDKIEQGLLKKSFTLSAYIDIASAFDKLSSTKATEALRRRGISNDIVNWYGNYLKNRYAIIEIKGIKTQRLITTGCPQGGVLSTMLWSIAFDDLLKLFDDHEVSCTGYADDGSLLICGNNLEHLYTQMNDALAKCQQWAESYGLGISVEKTSYMISTNKKRKSFKIPNQGIHINNNQIESCLLYTSPSPRDS